MHVLKTAALCFFMVVQVVGECNIPPSQWCSSEEVARTCQVYQQCKDYIQNTANVPVRFTLYYESLCPACKDFFIEQLYETFQKVGSIMNLTLVPYGNAWEQKIGDQWVFYCQGGKQQCIGNVIETCAINILKNIDVYLPFIHCIENYSGIQPSIAAQGCASQMNIDVAPILKCSTSKMGSDLEHQMAVKTNALQPRHTYVPWVTLNGVHTKAIQQKAVDDLKQLICETYQGGYKPVACSSLKRSVRSYKLNNKPEI
ncbi:gamma-interferon-inducible lysosomal thiol reductase-like isoform X2 [Lingula anatina]|uniref:Gamma-interferon-inducible lysosomal thiol reductase-like isoform X2 n=1 Tax=Lingula anatina TaxID=7574 RepID=A0A1S3I2Q5_LINAN|nr:gamma-interferon-inducible lysosomal thiol reductase-like isoform X2 [Lingula anatina]|eukprot:XP_013392550.1 gamma-interferon-inducible lysosomal thiol reductase-like isoform X2 [Lingula anatina]